MKIFVTGRSSNYERVIEAFDQIEAMGNEVAFRWTDLPMIKPYSENQEQAGKNAQNQIGGIIASDVFILFAHHDGTGVFAEFGAALALAELHGKPTIYAIGDEATKAAAMFHYHPLIKWHSSLEDVLEAVANS